MEGSMEKNTGKKAKPIMVLGTCSNAGKSLIAAGIARILTQKGYAVAPFKAQNMALNSYITGSGDEMGRAQVMQAEACRIEPDCRMNPVLLKPTSERGSQVILNGKVYDDLTASEYYKKKNIFRAEIIKAYESLAEENDFIVLEGAGSASEINLKDDDLVNMGMAEMIDAPVIIVGDIDRGGVFASLAGTMLLFDEEEKKRVKGVIINKFRGDPEILRPGLDMLEDIIERPVIGVVPYMDIDVDDEDSLTERFENTDPMHAKEKAAGSIHSGDVLDMAVIRLPRISNFTDFNPLEYMDGVNVRYVTRVSELGEPDMILIPGTKNTMADLMWMRQCGMEAAVMKYASKGKPVFGICGGYQILGREISDPDNVEHGGTIRGMGLLPHSTVFAGEKTTRRSRGRLSEVTGIFRELSGQEYQGYEIHMGVSETEDNIINNGNVYGTYMHGIFDRGNIASTVAEALMKSKGLDGSGMRAFDIDEYKQSQYDKLAEVLCEALDVELLMKIARGET